LTLFSHKNVKLYRRIAGTIFSKTNFYRLQINHDDFDLVNLFRKNHNIYIEDNNKIHIILYYVTRVELRFRILTCL